MNNSMVIRVSLAFFFLLTLGFISPAWSDPMTIVLPQLTEAAIADGATSSTALLTDQSFVSLRVREIRRNPDGSAVLEYVVTLENTSATAQPDEAGPELALYLPAGVQVEPGTLSATAGSVTVNGSQGEIIALEWNGDLAGANKTRARRQPGKATTTTTTVTTQITVPDLPIQGVMLVIDSEVGPQ